MPEGLVYLLEQFHMVNEASYWRNVLKMNLYQKERFTRYHCSKSLTDLLSTIINSMFGTIKGKILCLLGFSFKKDTSDTRDSPAIHVARYLVDNLDDISRRRTLVSEGAKVLVYDPKVAPEDITYCAPGTLVQYYFFPFSQSVACYFFRRGLCFCSRNRLSYRLGRIQRAGLLQDV